MKMKMKMQNTNVSTTAKHRTWIFWIGVSFGVVLLLCVIAWASSLVVLSSLDSARDKVADSTVKISLLKISSQANIDYDVSGSYEKICTDPIIVAAMSEGESAVNAKGVCNSNKTEYSAYLPLQRPISSATSMGWCVDSNWTSRESVNPGTATVCP